MGNENIYKYNDIKNNENKKNGIKGTTHKRIDLIDIKFNNSTNIMNKSHYSEILQNYQFSDTEIKFYSESNSLNDIYSHESSYTIDDFKNLLGWVPRNLKIVEPTSTDSIPCAFFFSNDNNLIKNDNIILYLHKFNEDLGTIIPTVYALHKKLNINVIAMEYSGYGVSFDNYEQKLVSIVNDSITILKFIVNYLKIPYNNICILCYEFLASCAIEIVNRFEYMYGKNKLFGGIIIIKPQILEIINSSIYKNDDIKIKENNCNNIESSKNLNDGYSYKSREEDLIIDENLKEQEKQENTFIKKKKKIIEKININEKRNNFNNKIEYRNILRTNYHAYNGIITCDMSLFYNKNIYKKNEDNDIEYLLMKRILKDTFDINHVKTSIKSISCPILIFHPENCSYKNSCSHILLNYAKKCFKKAAFSFDFMNEDFITDFKWFFSENCDSQKKEKLFKNLLYLYIHPKCNNIGNNENNNMHNELNKDFNSDYHNSLNNDFNKSYKNKNNINIPDEIFMCPEIIQKVNS